MKHVLFILIVALGFASCGTSTPSTQAEANANTQNPIMPITFVSNPTHVVLTDYLPGLSEEDSVVYSTEPSYSVTNISSEGFDLCGDFTLSVLSVDVLNKDLHYDIAILPAGKHVPAIVAESCTDSTLTIKLLHTYEHVQWRAFWQDTRLSVDAIEYGQYDKYATIHFDKAWQNTTGRSFLRVYARGDGEMLNDILIPLQDGKPVTDVAQLTRFDDQAQILYSLMIDRFHNGNKNNDWKMNSPEVLDIVDYQGGDIKGIQKKIEEGFFDQIVTENKELPESAKIDLAIAMITLKYTQSNSVCYVKGGQAIGIGAGQQSRIHCTRLAGSKADNWFLRQSPQVLGLQFVDGIKRADRDNAIDLYIGEDYMDVLAEGEWQRIFKVKPDVFTAEEKRAWLDKNTDVALGSDAFFPFGDNIERAHKSGVKYVAEPGGSIRDDHVIDTCNKYGMVMSFTGIRLFHH